MHQHPAEQRRSASVGRVRRGAAAALVATLTGLALAPGAAAEGLDGLRSNLRQVQQQQQNAQTDIADSTARVNSATAQLVQTQNELDNARARLSDIRVQLAGARAVDADLAIRLKAEQAALVRAKEEVARGEAALAEQVRLMGIAARDAYQQQNPLEGLSVVFDAGSTTDLSQRIQWNTTIFDTQAVAKERLDAIQVELNAARDRQAAIEAEVAEQKRAAARQVAVIKGLESEASKQAAAVQALAARHETMLAGARAELDADQAAYQQLKTQEDGIQGEIQAELARLKAEAERRAREEAERRAREEAERRAREEAERREAARKAAEAAAARRAADEAVARQSRKVPPPSRSNVAAPAPAPAPTVSTRSASDPTGYGVSRYGLTRPVDAPNGSPFGMRFHPILKYWRMHNGTDFGAPTGTPLYAAADGIVLKSGPNGGFGNFVLIGHNASINGRYVTTGYAHQSRIIVGVGQRVRQGQLIGYVGSTGLSTTPHLHFEVRLDGTPVNPMAYIP